MRCLYTATFLKQGLFGTLLYKLCMEKVFRVQLK